MQPAPRTFDGPGGRHACCRERRAEPPRWKTPMIAPTRQAGESVSVLIVEGEELLRELLHREVDDLGYDVAVVSDGRAAMERLRRRAYGVMLVDTRVSCPDLRALSAFGYSLHPGMKLVPLVPFTDGRALLAAMRLSPFAWLRMPFEVDELARTLELAGRSGGARAGTPALAATRARRPRAHRVGAGGAPATGRENE